MKEKFVYQCAECQKTFPRDAVRYLCPDCGQFFHPGEPLRGVLDVIFDYQAIASQFDVAHPDWNLLSAVEPMYYPPYTVGNTPFSEVKRLGDAVGYQHVWLKNDGLNPSGSLKDRASFLVVAEANRLKEKAVVAASTGNAASSLAAVCAAAGKEAIIFVPASAPQPKLVQMLQYGATVFPVAGTYDDAFKLSLEYTEKTGALNRNTAYHPLTIEGKKTVGFEIWQQNNQRVPDAILVPVGDGVIISGVYKAFYDLKMLGCIDRMPKLIAVQAEGSAALHHYLTTGHYAPVPHPQTVADSISVSAPSNVYLAKRAVEKTDGFSVVVTDDAILEAQHLLSRLTGIFAEPAAAAVVAGLQAISKNKRLPKDAQVVLLVTGHGLKDVASAMKKMQMPKIKETD